MKIDIKTSTKTIEGELADFIKFYINYENGSTTFVTEISYLEHDNTTIHVIDKSQALLFNNFNMQQNRAILKIRQLVAKEIEVLIDKYHITKEGGLHVIS